QQERRFKTELLAMRWQSYQKTGAELDAKLQTVAAEHNRLFVELRDLESQLEQQRGDYKTQQLQFNQVQGDYYGIVAEVGQLEQAIKHDERRLQETLVELGRTEQQANQAFTELDDDVQALEDIKHDLLLSEQDYQSALGQQQELQLQQQSLNQQRQAWQKDWQTYQQQHARFQQQAEVQRVKIAQLTQQQHNLQHRAEKLSTEQHDLSTDDTLDDIECLAASIELLDEQREELQSDLERCQQHIIEQRQQIKHTQSALHHARSEQQQLKGKITSLELLQQHAMGKDNKQLSAWLANIPHSSTRLAEHLEVEAGWETAVETVLAHALEAVCVDSVDDVLPHLDTLNQSLTVFARDSRLRAAPTETRFLSNKINSPWSLDGLLSGVYCAETLEDAQQLELKNHESVITKDGVWLGALWLKIQHSKDNTAGVLQREKQLRELKQQLNDSLAHSEELEQQLFELETALKQNEQQRDSLAQDDQRLGSELSLKNSELSAKSARLEQLQRRLAQVEHEQHDINSQLAHIADDLLNAHELKAEAEEQLIEQTERGQQLSETQHSLQNQYQTLEHALHQSNQQVFSLKAKIDSLKASENLTAKQIDRLQSQQHTAETRKQELLNKQQDIQATLIEQKETIVLKQDEKQTAELRLKQQRQIQEQLETAITELSKQHAHTQRALETEKAALDKLRFEQQEIQVREQTLQEQLQESHADISEVLKHLPENADEMLWKQQVDDLTTQIEKLGTINLTAIEEHKAQSERLDFLNAQHNDLIEALQTLELAIQKIDKESRLRFKETFDKINQGLQEKFPKLFGGGQAYLELTEQDLLESGVNIIARPPGKKNSSIHLLSGGEKALTAVALVFSIFELNPAPFCLLDEVDAPLDDANVGRFSKMVEEMSKTVQFLYISHNKVTMEISKQLAGVTMKEPGVSRMVAVDIEEAVTMAEI
ncbi:partial Chromosome partition protein Smc, partial [Patescibacteria group bacterium]